MRVHPCPFPLHGMEVESTCSFMEKNIQLIFLCSHLIEWTKHIGASDVASLRAVFPGIYIYTYR